MAMGDAKPSVHIPMPVRDRDRELLLVPPAAAVATSASAGGAGPDSDDDESKPSSASAAAQTGREAFHKVVHSWASKKFMTGCVILFPIAVTFYITWWFFRFVDGFFSPIYAHLGINIFGLGFVTSISFILWLEYSCHLGWGHLFLISAAISPDQNKHAFKEVVIIRHPRIGEYAFGFITSEVLLQSYSSEEQMYCVYVPTNHLYIGDIFLINSSDVIRPNLSVREGIEIVVSGGMSMPQVLSILETEQNQWNRMRSSRS
ncbi:hypothetical protein GUJ93_ZPchr0002g25928 [Zizania palustris]|uniref:COV1-like protein n=1 Tax=Zizania palustris TaxID=103762 RepID=A0A8J5S253_ZIZPA|nr:hypothetical protein GUJ93_ZPchr0002g25928 [Zizania palustris]